MILEVPPKTGKKIYGIWETIQFPLHSLFQGKSDGFLGEV